MRRRAVRKIPLLATFLLPALLFLLGAAPGPQLDAEQAVDQVRSVPEVQNYLQNPTVNPSARYDASRDVWRVTLTEQETQTTVARVSVDDDTRTVEQVSIAPAAEDLDYPELSAREATKLAAANPRIEEELDQYDGYSSDAEYADGEWTVHFYADADGGDGRQEIARSGVNDESWALSYVYTGDQVSWQMARGESGAYGKEANYWYVWGPLALVFALAFIRTDKLFSIRNLDILALLGFLVSHGFFRQGISYEAVLLWYPPLIYLFFRTLLMGFGVGERVERTGNFPTWLLFVLAAVAGGFLLYLNLDSRVIDVGYAGVAGAESILDGNLPYGNMPSDVGTGDTYGPLNYLLYAPFILLFGYSGEWDFLPAAHALTVFAFIAGIFGLFYAGWRLSGPKVAATLVFAWVVFPYTLYSTNNNTNDIIVAAIAAIGLAAAASPAGRGATIAAGFAVKLFPLLLGPLWLLHDGWRVRPAVKFFIGGAVVLAGSFWILFLGGNPIEAAQLFYEKTLAFQGERDTPWTIFTQVPELAFLQQPLTFAVAMLAVAVAVLPGRRTVRRLAALSAALVIGFQLTANYWFYPYITWFEPFIFLALLPATNEKTPLDGERPNPAAASEEQETVA